MFYLNVEIMVPCRNGCTLYREIVKLLLERGAEVDLRNGQGATSLHDAVQR